MKLINCETEGCDLAFEYSDVDADIVGNIISIKNPKSGTIKVDSVDEIINEDSIIDVNGKVIIKWKWGKKYGFNNWCRRLQIKHKSISNNNT